MTRDSISADIKLFLEAGGHASVSESELARIPGFEVADVEAKESRQRLLANAHAIRLLKEEGYAAEYDCFTDDAACVCACHFDRVSARYSSWAAET
jgi:hypothetical protein